VLEAKLTGAALADTPDMASTEHVAQLTPIDDIRASADYRRHAALMLVRDLLSDLARSDRRRAA
jgi:N-methylhydantoinase B